MHFTIIRANNRFRNRHIERTYNKLHMTHSAAPDYASFSSFLIVNIKYPDVKRSELRSSNWNVFTRYV